MNVLLQGNDRLGSAIGQRLSMAGCKITRLPGGSDLPAFDAAALDSVAVLILASDDDAGNVDMALTARRLRPDLPLVVRLFDESLASYLKSSLNGITILSMSGIAAPVLADATLRAIGNGSERETAKPKPRARRPVEMDRVLLTAVVVLAGMLVLFSVYFYVALNIPYVDALYFVFTTFTTVGYGDIALRDSSAAVKLVGMVQMFVGAAFLAVLFGLFTDWVFKRRLDIVQGRVQVRGRGHVVIVGGGNIGFRVAERLREQKRHIVVVERDANNKNIAALRSAGDHVILADATREETLQLASVENAAAALCLTESDAVNFQVALLVRAQTKDVPILMRVVSPELSAHVSEQGDAVAVSSIAIAAEEFSKAALDMVKKPGNNDRHF